MTPYIITTILTGVGVVFGSLFVIRHLLERFRRDITTQLGGLSTQIEEFGRDISGQLSAINTKIDNVIRDRLEGERGPGREPDTAL